jgi:predicted transcriptional regulator
VRDSDLDEVMDLTPFMNPVPISVREECPLSRVFVLFRSLGIRHLIVTDIDNHVQGIISRQTIMSSFQQDLF